MTSAASGPKGTPPPGVHAGAESQRSAARSPLPVRTEKQKAVNTFAPNVLRRSTEFLSGHQPKRVAERRLSLPATMVSNPPNESKKIRQNFEKHVEGAKELYAGIAQLENNHRVKIQKAYVKFNGLMDEATTPTALEAAHTNLYTVLDKIRKSYNARLETQIKNLEQDLSGIASLYNLQSKGKEVGNPDVVEMEQVINRLNEKKLGHYLASSDHHSKDYKLLQFQATLEKKYSLLQQEMKLNSPSAIPSSDPEPEPAAKKGGLFRGIGNRFQKTSKEMKAHNIEFSKIPNKEKIEELKAAIDDSVNSPSKSIPRKELSDTFSELNSNFWAKDFLSTTLKNPANWVNKYDLSIVIGDGGKAHVFETKVVPQNIDRKPDEIPSGVPSSARAKNTRPANLQKTESFRLDISDPENPKKDESSVVERWRIGQLATKEAAKEAVLTMVWESSKKVTELHDNMLLTTTGLNIDKKLAREQKENLTAVFKDLTLDEINKGPHKYTETELIDLKKNYMQTNFGVNEGAIGKIKAGIEFSFVKLGWHTSIDEFTNKAIPDYNRVLRGKINSLMGKGAFSKEGVVLLERLGGIVQVGQELEAVWAKNDFANPNLGNQFKAPGLMSVVDSLAGITVNTHCKSAKDRGSLVEGYALEKLQSIQANIEDRKAELRTQFEGKIRESYPKEEFAVQILCSGAFSQQEIEEVCDSEDKKSLQKLVEGKCNAAKTALGLGVHFESDFLQQKKVVGGIFRKFFQGTFGISKNTPLREIESAKEYAAGFPKVFSSMYEEVEKVRARDLSEFSPKIYSDLLKHQRQKIHQRLNCSMAMQVTKENTGVPGNKVKKGEPLRIFYSGFDRNYVRYQLFFAAPSSEDFKKKMIESMGLNELSEEDREEILKRGEEIRAGRNYKIHDCDKIIKKVEYLKGKQFYPAMRVKS